MLTSFLNKFTYGGVMIKNSPLRTLINISMFAALTGILAQVAIPLPFNLIPITGQTLAIGLTATILGSKKSTYAVIVYCLMGIMGLPVFSKFQAGIGVLLGPTGGFIVGFIPTALIIGWILEKSAFTIRLALFANVIGMFVTLLFGTGWLKISTDISWTAAFSSAFVPFIFVGLLKAYLASLIGITIRSRLIQAKLLSTKESLVS